MTSRRLEKVSSSTRASLVRRANASIARPTFFLPSKRLRESRVGRDLRRRNSRSASDQSEKGKREDSHSRSDKLDLRLLLLLRSERLVSREVDSGVDNLDVVLFQGWEGSLVDFRGKAGVGNGDVGLTCDIGTTSFNPSTFSRHRDKTSTYQ
jgi:hypothetical protein